MRLGSAPSSSGLRGRRDYRRGAPSSPHKEQVMQDFITLSKAVGINNIGWRYDPIFIDNTYTLERHVSDFETILFPN
ncbi:MAG: DUF1848 family protein [Ruminococcus sp.]|nr:DUF1848 family protein [Ruminococcus sp.]MBQ9895536.1 DUF1848 family protein [Ruminococcus sp.]